jgi:hypothetical protein
VFVEEGEHSLPGVESAAAMASYLFGSRSLKEACFVPG